MDRKFLEFWGNVLLSAAKGQEQVETLSRLAGEGFKTFEQQLALFQKFYGLDRKPDPAAPYAEMWKKAAEDFVQSYQEFMGLMGMVPREDYEALAREHEALKKKVEELEESLRKTKKRPGVKDADPSEIVKGFEGIGAMPGDVVIFSKFMDSHSLFLTANADTVYYLTGLDLSKGPVVVEQPPDAVGTINDMCWIMCMLNAVRP